MRRMLERPATLKRKRSTEVYPSSEPSDRSSKTPRLEDQAQPTGAKTAPEGFLQMLEIPGPAISLSHEVLPNNAAQSEGNSTDLIASRVEEGERQEGFYVVTRARLGDQQLEYEVNFELTQEATDDLSTKRATSPTIDTGPMAADNHPNEIDTTTNLESADEATKMALEAEGLLNLRVVAATLPAESVVKHSSESNNGSSNVATIFRPKLQDQQSLEPLNPPPHENVLSNQIKSPPGVVRSNGTSSADASSAAIAWPPTALVQNRSSLEGLFPRERVSSRMSHCPVTILSHRLKHMAVQAAIIAPPERLEDMIVTKSRR